MFLQHLHAIWEPHRGREYLRVHHVSVKASLLPFQLRLHDRRLLHPECHRGDAPPHRAEEEE